MVVLAAVVVIVVVCEGVGLADIRPEVVGQALVNVACEAAPVAEAAVNVDLAIADAAATRAGTREGVRADDNHGARVAEPARMCSSPGIFNRCASDEVRGREVWTNSYGCCRWSCRVV